MKLSKRLVVTPVATLAMLLSTGAQESCEPTTVPSGDTPQVHTIWLRSDGSARKRRIIINWHGRRPDQDIVTGGWWTKIYKMRAGGRKVTFKVWNMYADKRSVGCIIHINGRERAIQGPYRKFVMCETRLP